jgi:hypothetical protein
VSGRFGQLSVLGSSFFFVIMIFVRSHRFDCKLRCLRKGQLNAQPFHAQVLKGDSAIAEVHRQHVGCSLRREGPEPSVHYVTLLVTRTGNDATAGQLIANEWDPIRRDSRGCCQETHAGKPMQPLDASCEMVTVHLEIVTQKRGVPRHQVLADGVRGVR